MLLAIAEAMQTTVEELYARHTKAILDSMGSSYENWTVYSVEQLIFDSLLSRAGNNVIKSLITVARRQQRDLCSLRVKLQLHYVYHTP